MMQDADGRSSATRGSNAALSDQDAVALLQELVEQKRKEREQDAEVKRVKNKYKLKAPMYPSPGNVLHTGRQLPRTPAPGVLPLLPSQKFDPRTEEDEEEFGSRAVRTPDNMVPCGRQLARTPTKAIAMRENAVKEGENCKSANKSEHDGNDAVCDTVEGEMAKCERDKNGAIICDPVEEAMARSECDGNGSICDTTEREMATNDRDGNSAIICDTAETARRECGDGNCAVSRISNVMPDLVNSDGRRTTVQKEAIGEDAEVHSRPMIQNNRRISEMPVRGLNRMRISGVLEKMAGYECRNEDLEFLKYVENQEKAKVLKEVISEDIEARSRPMTQNTRRISEMPVHGLNRMRISGVLKKMAGYECRNEDLEFLKYMETQEKAKVLKSSSKQKTQTEEKQCTVLG